MTTTLAEPEAQAATPCGSTPCWSPTPITFTTTSAGLKATATSGFTGSVTYNWGDGSSSRGRGAVSHTYAAAGTYQVVASPMHSSCSSSSAPKSVTVA